MNQWDRLPPGSKRRSDFTDPERPGSYHFPIPRQSYASQSSEASTSPHSSQEGQTPKTVEHLPSLTARTGIAYEFGDTRLDASSHSSSSGMRLPTPSPTSSATYITPPIAWSSSRPASYTPRSINLLHKSGTDDKTDLATAYAQAQIIIADLDTKFQASRVENGNLAQERQRLVGRIELLEAQVEQLEQSVQQTQTHAAVKDAQYSRIVELATRLQRQAAAECEARKLEQHEWFSDKRSMQSVIDSLKIEMNGLRKAYTSFAQSTNPTPAPIDHHHGEMEGNPMSAAESSSHKYIADMEVLRRANARMEDALAGVERDNAQLAENIEKLGSLEKNIQMRLQRTETARGTLDMLGWEDTKAAGVNRHRDGEE